MKLKHIVLLLLFSLSLVNAQPESITICALRVDFTEDQNTLTTGNGLFMIDTLTQDNFAIDPAPHNRLYFEDQIRAVAHYFENVSGGKQEISGTVFPLAADSAYHLPHPMGWYNPNGTEEQNNLGLARLLSDAVEAAKNSGDVDFSDFNLVVVFHAGVGKDVDVGYDETPQDIPSLFITPAFLKDAFGNDFDGIDVGQNKKINSGIILPETENQDGLSLALTGMFAANIGSALGLYDLFSPSKQRTGIGRFGLMDMGLMNMNGLIPSPPGAFSRHQLHWDEVHTLDRPQTDVRIRRLGAEDDGTPSLIQIPINEDEYFLIEYRGDSAVNLDSLYGLLANGRSQLPTYLELLEIHFHDQIERGQSGVLISVPDYDWGIPGAGLLIWHIDERVIAEKGTGGSINDDPLRRAVDIEEADRSQDIGQKYPFPDSRSGIEFGWFADFWYKNNPAYQNGVLNEFSDSSSPNTRSNYSRSASHITISDFSDNTAATMSFDFSRGWQEAPFPVSLFEDKTSSAVLTAGAVDGQTQPFLFAAGNNGGIYAMDSRSKGLIDSASVLFYQGAAFDNHPSLALADFDQNGKYDHLFVAGGDSLLAFDLQSGMPVFKYGFTSPVVSGPVLSSAGVAVGCANDSLYLFNFAGEITGSYEQETGATALLLDTGGAPVIFDALTSFAALLPLFESETNLLVYEPGAQNIKIYDYSNMALQISWTAVLQPVGPPAVVDVDANGVYDIIFNQQDGIYAYNRSGFLLNGFPLRPVLSDDEHLIGSPLILDADGDGNPDYIAATDKGNIIGLHGNGRTLNGFPLTTGGEISATPFILNMDDDAALEIAALNTSGSLYVWQLEAAEGASSVKWTSVFNSPGHNLRITEALQQQSAGSTLLPAKRVYNYPNPNSGNTTTIRYYLNKTANVTIRIFDASGMPVDEFNGPGQAGVDNEIKWNVENIASGVYLCRVKAVSASRSESRIIKIMVVH